ncbi:MAG: hypothetical protein LC687_07125, partial [Actinobacteria bacterium]|nr:hypothetical protein [Actinomycetota bacterium]
PDRIFWQYAGPLLLRKPKDVPEWSSGWGGGWAYKRDEPPLAEVVKRRLGSSTELHAIAALAKQAGCEEWAERQLIRIFRDHLYGSGTLGASADAA